MKNHHSRRILPLLFIAVGLCLLASVTARAGSNRSIVGLWDVHYFAGTTEIFHTYVQWHSDGLEFEVNSVYPGAVCQGVFRQNADGRVRDFHVVFTYDDTGKVSGHIEEEINVVVDSDADEYHGVADQKFFDLAGNVTGTGSLTVQATKIKLH